MLGRRWQDLDLQLLLAHETSLPQLLVVKLSFACWIRRYSVLVRARQRLQCSRARSTLGAPLFVALTYSLVICDCPGRSGGELPDVIVLQRFPAHDESQLPRRVSDSAAFVAS